MTFRSPFLMAGCSRIKSPRHRAHPGCLGESRNDDKDDIFYVKALPGVLVRWQRP